MGIFDKVDTDSDRDEVVVDVADDESSSSGSGALKDEVETRLGSGETGSSDEIDIETIHEQNERIIELLEQLTSDNSGGSSSRSRNSSSSRRNSSRRNDSRRDDSDNDYDNGGGLDGVL